MTDVSAVNRALMRVPRRAEMSDPALLERTFVDLGSLSLLMESRDHQIFFGRRGTGKTHALKHLGARVERAGDVPVYVDMRTTGDAGFYADADLPVAERGTALLVDMFERLHEGLFTWAVESAVETPVLARALDDLASAITQVEVVGEVEHDAEVGRTAHRGREVQGFVHLAGDAGLRLQRSRQDSVSSTERVRRSGVERHQVLFGPLGRAVRSFAEAIAPRRLWVLIDEWSSVPLALQPLVAELVRRSLLPVPGITVKIAAIEQRSHFIARRQRGDFLGIEVGADVSASLDLDDILSEHDDGGTGTRSFMAEMLWRHVAHHLDAPEGPVEQASGGFVATAFRKGAFGEFARAAQGVPRDAINVAALAAQKAGGQPIGVMDVRRAARDWYMRDKLANLRRNRGAQELLKQIVNHAVAERPNRCFLVDTMRDAGHPLLQDLYDARIVHVLRRGLVIDDDPGTLYDLYVVDYGYFACHLDSLKKGTGIPQPMLHWTNRSSVIDVRRMVRDLPT